MNGKTIQVFKQEIYALVSRRSFWLASFGVPMVALLVYLFVGNLNRQQAGEETAGNPMGAIAGVLEEEPDLRPQGFVDQSGIVAGEPPASLFAGEERSLVRFESETEARAALDRGELSAYYVIPVDYVETGNLLIYAEEFSLMDSEDQADSIDRMIDHYLLQGDETMRQRISAPLALLEEKNLSGSAKETARGEDDGGGASFFVPYTVMMLLYISLMTSSGMLLNSVTKEKENRVMEVLLLSTHPRELLMGKILGLGVVGLFQMAIWAASGLALLRMGGQTFNLPEAYQLDPIFLMWTLLYFILGYLVYAALMAGVGALVPNLREASQATIYVALPLMLPLFLINALIGSPNSGLSVFFSLFPFTAPITMMLRMAATDVPLWQVLVSLALLAVTALIVIRAVAGMFRAQSLLSGSPFKLKVFLKALAGKA